MNKSMCKSIFILCLVGMIAAISLSAAASINVIASTPELADITKQVGGDRVSVYSIAKPNHDYHMIEPRPSDVSRISKADLVIRVGLDLDMWMDALLNAAGNKHVSKNGPGYVDTSIGIVKLDVPHEQVTGASGDIHVYGNPHYFYDPENGKIIARNILRGLIKVSPGNKAVFENNYQGFTNQLDSRISEWKKELNPYKGRSVITYHKSSVYFLRRFGLKQFGELEPKPGIPPTAPHIKAMIKRIKEEKVTAMVIDSIYSRKFPDLITRETGVKYVVTPYSVGSLGTKSYLSMIELMVSKYKEALE
ncbi:MAG: metal ABC transporter substrate-binding protein [Armatimonadota bacterium]